MINVEFKLLGNGRAFVLNRNPHVAKEKMRLKFSGAPAGATAIISSKGEAIYRSVEDGCCTLPVSLLEGEILITVSMLNGSHAPKAWQCESLVAKKLPCGSTLVHPDDMNLPSIVATLAVENDELRREQTAIKEEMAKLNTKIERILEGYDII